MRRALVHIRDVAVVLGTILAWWVALLLVTIP